MQVANLPKVLKPVIGGEATGKSNRRTCRGDWGERVPKERSDRWEIRRDAQEETNGQRRQGNHNLPNGHGRKSDRPIRAMKRGNACRAKGPNVSRVFIEAEEVRLSPSGSRTGQWVTVCPIGNRNQPTSLPTWRLGRSVKHGGHSVVNTLRREAVGEPDTGNLYVRFDEGGVGHGLTTMALSSTLLLKTKGIDVSECATETSVAP